MCLMCRDVEPGWKSSTFSTYPSRKCGQVWVSNKSSHSGYTILYCTVTCQVSRAGWPQVRRIFFRARPFAHVSRGSRSGCKFACMASTCSTIQKTGAESPATTGHVNRLPIRESAAFEVAETDSHCVDGHRLYPQR